MAASRSSSDAQLQPAMTSAFWFEEGIVENSLTIRMRLKSLRIDAQSKFQRVQVIETEPFGKTLVLDGKTQSTKLDEVIYHESLVHPAMLLHGSPKRVYIGGGGELATARECLRHTSIDEVIMVDLDEMVVNVCKEHMAEWNAGATDDPRFKLIIGDARSYLLDAASGTFDVIVLDISDPIEAGPAVHLYTKEFYDLVKAKLRPGGVVVTQSGPAGVFNCEECFTAIHHTLKATFARVEAYTTNIPSFGSDWGFNVASDITTDFGDIDDKISKNISGGAVKLMHYDAQTHTSMFSLTKRIRNAITHETRVITTDNLVFMY